MTVHCEVQPQAKAEYRLSLPPPPCITRVQLRRALALLRTDDAGALFALARTLREVPPAIEISRTELAAALAVPLDLDKKPGELADIIMKRVARNRTRNAESE